MNRRLFSLGALAAFSLSAVSNTEARKHSSNERSKCNDAVVQEDLADAGLVAPKALGKRTGSASIEMEIDVQANVNEQYWN